jgi:uncharacterized protein (TIGR00299 family) protein
MNSNLLVIDPFSGISGDMFLGLAIDLGADPEQLRRELEKLALPGWSLDVRREQRRGIEGLRALVVTAEEPSHRNWATIRTLLEGAPLEADTRDLALRIFQRIVAAEARVHGQDPDQVHFHEVGALDSILDIVGAAVALNLLDHPQVFCRPLPLSRGTLACAHGRYPVPAPAVLEILQGLPLTDSALPHELVTPTGAAIIAEIADFGAVPDFVPIRTGYGVGSRDLDEQPNLLRGILGQALEPGLQTDRITLIETDLDDVNPEWLGPLLTRLLREGALDASYCPVQMKKGRPGVRITVLAPPERTVALSRILLLETSAIGVRCHEARRWKLERETRTLATPLGEARVKLISQGGKLLRVTPEFESCQSLAESSGLPLPEVYRLVTAAAAELFPFP